MSGLDEVLAASLESAFEPSPDIAKSTVSVSPQPSASSSAVVLNTPAGESAAVTESNPSAEGAGDSSDAWKDDYEKYLAHWQAESAVARQKAEETREMWEKRRAEEKKAGKERKYDWESYIQPPSQVQDHHRRKTSVGDARDFVPGAEAQKGSGKETLDSMLPPIEEPNPPYPSSLNNPQTSKHSPDSNSSERENPEWTQVNNPRSVESSFPDISFPSHPSTPHRQHSKLSEKADKKDLPHPPSATLTIFDSTLSTRTRLLALTSALAINFLLPFVNGVMLGFGEIFARNVVSWIGWKSDSKFASGASGRNTSATAIGIGAVGRGRREDMARKEL